jgi:hypothetical protein
VSNLHAANDGKTVRYNGKTFEISVFNQEIAETEISNAKHVYAFEIADFNLNMGNTDENLSCMYNNTTQEYAVTTYVKDDEKGTKWLAIIFSPNGAKMIEYDPTTKDHLPGFNNVDICTKEMGLVGYCNKAGYVHAICNGKLNSVIVFIK